jgi:hypothetical protein
MGSVGTDRVRDDGIALCRNGGSSMKSPGIAPAGVEHCGASTRVDAGVRERLGNCAYAYYFNRVTWHYVDGTLTLEGYVPTFYMKQILQTVLRNLEHVERIANEVDVVSSTGLSSERSR